MSEDDIGLALFLVLFFGGIGFLIFLKAFPNSRLSRGVRGFFNTPAILRARDFVYQAIGVFFVISLVVLFGWWYFIESGWYPRTREVRMYFNARGLIDGEIQTCYSGVSVTDKTPDAELLEVVCALEKNESHVLKVTFWGPIKADKNKIWKCERNSTRTVCKLQ